MGLVVLGDAPQQFKLTRAGCEASKLPVDVEQAVCILESLPHGKIITQKVLKIVALLQLNESISSALDGETKKLTQFQAQ